MLCDAADGIAEKAISGLLSLLQSRGATQAMTRPDTSPAS
jgi:hypothetical protein